MTLEETVDIAYKAWSRRDIDTLVTVVHPDAVARPILGANIGTSVYHGHDGLRAWFRDLHQEWEAFKTGWRASRSAAIAPSSRSASSRADGRAAW